MADREIPTPLTPEQLATMTPEQKDAWWFKNVYQGDRMPQLTWRAVVMGGFLGMLMSAANLYTTLSIGWAFGIAITACVLSFVMWNFIRFCGRGHISQMSVLENACMASCASAAGYSTGSTIATMFGALVLLYEVPEGTPLSRVYTWDVTSPWVVVLFTLCTGLMGVFLAIPMKRQQINHEQLPFPSGIAAAETLRSLYSESKEAIRQAYALVVGLGAGLLIGFLRVGDDVLDAVGFLRKLFNQISFLRIPEKIDMALIDRLYPATRHASGFAFDPSALLIAAGMIVGMRTSLSLLASSLLLYGVIAPRLAEADALHMAKGADAVLSAVKDAAAGKTEPKQIAEAATTAVDAAAEKLAIKDIGAVKAGARRGGAGALDEIAKADAMKAQDAVVAAAGSLGLSTAPIEFAGRRAAREAGDGPDRARSGAALAMALRQAAAKNVGGKPIVDAAEKADREASDAADKVVGERVLAAVLDAAGPLKADAARIRGAADEKAKAAKASPGRAGAAGARAMAVKIVYDELEADPAPINEAADRVGAAANAEASKKVADAVVAAVIAEAGKLGLDGEAIAKSAEAAGLVAGEGEGPARVAGALEAAIFAAVQAKIDPAPIRAAATDVKFTQAELNNRIKIAVEGVGGAAAAAAGANWANDGAIAAREEAKAKSLAAGATYKKTKEAADAAFEAARYKPNLIWNWGAGEITLTRWSLWGGTAVMVFSSLMSVAMQWKTIARALRGVKASATEGEGELAAMKAIEVPTSWMILGMLPITIAMVWLQVQAFEVSWYAGVIAVLMSFVLSLVASRATGETDTTPIGAMGKVMQLMFAVLAPKNIAANLASAGIAANSASSSADLLTDLKTGYLLGANPRRQFLAQFFGVFFGTIAIVPIWYLMVPTRAKLETFALPSTRAWEAVARVLVKGVGALPPSAVYAIFIGAAVGIILPLIERLMPPKARRFMPSATGVGLAWVMPFNNVFSFFVGAVIVMAWTRLHKRTADQYNIPLASGLIAGESLMAAALAITATAVGLIWG